MSTTTDYMGLTLYDPYNTDQNVEGRVFVEGIAGVGNGSDLYKIDEYMKGKSTTIVKTSAQWEEDSTTILRENDFGIASDTGIIKRGDGINVWQNLDYFKTEIPQTGESEVLYILPDETIGTVPPSMSGSISFTLNGTNPSIKSLTYTAPDTIVISPTSSYSAWLYISGMMDDVVKYKISCAFKKGSTDIAYGEVSFDRYTFGSYIQIPLNIKRITSNLSVEANETLTLSISIEKNTDTTYPVLISCKATEDLYSVLLKNDSSIGANTVYTLKNGKQTSLAEFSDYLYENVVLMDDDAGELTTSFTEADTRENINSGESLSILFGKIRKFFTDLGTLAFKSSVKTDDISDGNITSNKIAANAITNEKQAVMAPYTIKGNNTNSNSAPQDITSENALIMLGAQKETSSLTDESSLDDNDSIPIYSNINKDNRKISWSNIKKVLGDLFVPVSRKINNKPLSSDITLNADDVGAESSGSVSSHNESTSAHNALFNNKQNTILASGILKGTGSEIISAIAGTDFAVPAQTKTATLLSSAWGDTAPYSQTVVVSGITEDIIPIIDIELSDTQSTAEQELIEWSKVSRIDSSSGTIVAKCFSETPTIDLNLRIRW